MKYIIRRLTIDDIPSYRVVRLRALKEHPEVFGQSYEDALKLSDDDFRKQFESHNDEQFLLGAFLGDQLVGTLYFGRETGHKKRHKAVMGAMYVIPEVRGKGLGRALLTDALDYASTLEGLEDIGLGVMLGNETARQLYASMGFDSVCVTPHYLKIDEQYYDLEWMVRKLG